MMRCLVAALALIAAAPNATGQSQYLSLETARAVVARTGVNVGTVFADGERRYLITSVNSRSPRPNVFEVTVAVRQVR